MTVTNGLTEPRSHLARSRVNGAHSKQRDLIVKVNEALNHYALILRGHVSHHGPGLLHILFFLKKDVPLPGGRNIRFHDARQPQLPHRLLQLLSGLSKAIGGDGQADALSHLTHALAALCQLTGPRRRHNGGAEFLDTLQRLHRDGLHLRDHIVRFDALCKLPHLVRVPDVCDVAKVRELLRGCSCVAVHGVDLQP